MAEKFRNPLMTFIGLSLLYFIEKLLKAGFPDLYLLHYYFTDLLFIPVQLTATLILTRLLKNDHLLIISSANITAVVLSMCLLFEIVLPETDVQRQTGDWIDCLMYVAGGITYSVVQRRYFMPSVNKI